MASQAVKPPLQRGLLDDLLRLRVVLDVEFASIRRQVQQAGKALWLSRFWISAVTLELIVGL